MKNLLINILLFTGLFIYACTPIEYKALDPTWFNTYKLGQPEFVDGEGNCVAFAKAHAMYLGMDYYTMGTYKGRSHAWVESNRDGKCYIVDINSVTWCSNNNYVVKNNKVKIR